MLPLLELKTFGRELRRDLRLATAKEIAPVNKLMKNMSLQHLRRQWCTSEKALLSRWIA